MVEILNRNKIPTFSIELYYSFNKFKKFIETCNDDKKKAKYTELYKKALRMQRLGFLLTISVMVSFFILTLLITATRK
jgi:hypothetical protein